MVLLPHIPKYNIRVISGIEWLRNFTRDTEVWREKKSLILTKLATNVVQEIQVLMASDLFNKMSQRTMNSVKFSVEGNRATVYIDPSVAQYLVYHEYGVRPQPMNWLLGKTIPFIIRDGKFVFAGSGSQETVQVVGGGKGLSKKLKDKFLISPEDVQFRKVTQASLAKGSWFHPGIKPKKFFVNGIKAGLRRTTTEIPQLSFKLEVINRLEGT